MTLPVTVIEVPGVLGVPGANVPPDWIVSIVVVIEPAPAKVPPTTSTLGRVIGAAEDDGAGIDVDLVDPGETIARAVGERAGASVKFSVLLEPAPTILPSTVPPAMLTVSASMDEQDVAGD